MESESEPSIKSAGNKSYSFSPQSLKKGEALLKDTLAPKIIVRSSSSKNKSRDEREVSFGTLRSQVSESLDAGFMRFFFMERGKVMETSELTKKFEGLANINNLGINDNFGCFRTVEAWKKMLTDNKDLFRWITEAQLGKTSADSGSYERLTA
jgi:hypothetical protein